MPARDLHAVHFDAILLAVIGSRVARSNSFARLAAVFYGSGHRLRLSGRKKHSLEGEGGRRGNEILAVGA